MPDAANTVVVNTLSGALSHYTRELTHALSSGGSTTAVIEIPEPSQSGKSGLHWLSAYVRALIQARRMGGRVIVTWPVLGYIDVILVSIVLGRRGHLIMHDPRPLVHARGYGRGWQQLASAFDRTGLIVHSDQARGAVGSHALRRRAVLMPHPMLPPRARAEARSAGPVRVLGQYKPDRDLGALRQIAKSGIGLPLEIVGRRWPTVEGWSVRPEFVAEEEMDALLAGSSVVVIPYKRFYQSGVAIRSLEWETPVVGPAGTSMDQLLGYGSRLLAREEWTSAIKYATSSAGAEVRSTAAKWYRHSSESWGRWARDGR